MASSTRALMLPEQYYHVYNRTNGSGRLFFTDENYKFFLRQVTKYGSGFWEVCAYALLSNHFHLVVRVCPKTILFESGKQILDTVLKRAPQLGQNWDFDAENLNDIEMSEDTEFLGRLGHLLIAEQMRRLFLSYSKAINNQQGRHGSLFQKQFRRKLIPIEDVAQVIMYVHRNPVHHGYVRNASDYAWCSYEAYASDLNSRTLAKQRILDLFSGAQNLKQMHESYTYNTIDINMLESII